MGNRLHVAKTYIVEYSDYEEFNWQQEGFRNLMNALEIELCGETWCGEIWDFEIAKEDWEKGMERLRIDEGNREINRALQSLGKTGGEMLEIMETYLKESDPDFDYLEFSFF